MLRLRIVDDQGTPVCGARFVAFDDGRGVDGEGVARLCRYWSLARQEGDLRALSDRDGMLFVRLADRAVASVRLAVASAARKSGTVAVQVGSEPVDIVVR